MATANSKLKIDHGFDSFGSSNVTGDLRVSGNLNVTGTLLSGGTATGDWITAVDGSLLGNSVNRWTLFANSGNFANTLTVTGATSLQDTLTVTRTLASGNVTITGFANVSTTLQVTGNTLLSGNVSVTGQATISNTLSTGNTTITGFINVSSTANVGGAVNLRGDLTVNGAVTVSNTTQFGNTTVTGFVNVSSTANVGGNFNVAGLTTLTGNTTISGTSHTVTGNTSFDGGVLFVDGANNRVGVNNTTPGVALEVTGAANVSVSVNSALLTVGTAFIANTTGAYHTGTVNAASFTTFDTTVTGLLANTTAIVPTGTAANTVLLGNSIGRFVISANSLSTAGLSVNASGMFPASNTDGTSLGNTIARWVVTANTGDFSGGITSGTIGPTSNGLLANTTAILVGNSSVNVSIVPAGITISGSTGLVPHSNTTGVNLGSATQRWVLTANTGNFTGTVTGTVANMSTSVNSALLTVGTSFIANTTGAYHTGVVNAASHTVGTNFIANSSAIVGTGFANVTTSVNSALLTVGASFIANTTGAYHTGTVNAASFTTTNFRANNSGVYHTGTINAASFTTTGFTANVTGIYASSNGIILGDNTTRFNVSATSISVSGSLLPTSNTLLLGNSTARFIVSANTLNTSGIITAGAGITANGATGTAGQVLQSGGSGANVHWATPFVGFTVVADNSTNDTRYITFANSTSGTTSNTYVDTGLTYNPGTGVMTAVQFSASSDERLKTNITTISHAVDTLLVLRGVSYVMNSTNTVSTGVIAQEVEQVMPFAVTTDSQGYKSVNYNAFIGLLIEAIKDLKTEIDELKNSIKIN